MISYAQNFEDVMLYRVFRDQPTGFYVDVGAADPVHHSVTKWFYDMGWSGINVEPRSVFFEALQRERPRDVNLNCGAGEVSGEVPFFEMSLTPEWSSFDDIARTEAMARGEAIVEHTIPILTLNEIVERHGGGRTIDFLKIDVEGWERQVLSGLDLMRHRPIIVVVEATHQGTAERDEAKWEDILTSAGYKAIYFDGLNKFYVERRRIRLAKHFAVPPNVFDGYTINDLAVLERDRAAWLEAIHALEQRLGESETDRAARLEVIHALEQRLSASEAGQAARLEAIHALGQRLVESEADRGARLEVIHALEQRLSESEADRAARLEVIHVLDKERLALTDQRLALIDRLKIVESERNQLHENVAIQNNSLAALYREINVLGRCFDDVKVVDNASALRLLERARRILNLRIVRLWSRFIGLSALYCRAQRWAKR